MGWLDSLFGGESTKGMKWQQRENQKAQDFIQQMQQQGRGDLFNLFPYSQQARHAGTQGALDVFGQTLPQQIGATQAGSMGAQAALLAGLPQIQNAIMGLPVNMSAMQPMSIPVDTSYTQQTLPPLPDYASALGGSMPQGFSQPSAGGAGGNPFAGLLGGIGPRVSWYQG